VLMPLTAGAPAPASELMCVVDEAKDIPAGILETAHHPDACGDPLCMLCLPRD
jgi:hypothetical protein